jgi:hypothetical protein
LFSIDIVFIDTMPHINITVPHQLGQDAATQRLKNKLQEVKDQKTYTVTDVVETWTNPHTMEFSFRVYGFSLTGSVRSLPANVTIAVDLPVVAMMFQGTIEDQVRKELTRLLE